MGDEYDLRPSARRTDPETSFEAWERIRKTLPGTLRVLEELFFEQGREGYTYGELVEAINGAEQTISTSISQLERNHRIVRGLEYADGLWRFRRRIWSGPPCPRCSRGPSGANQKVMTHWTVASTIERAWHVQKAHEKGWSNIPQGGPICVDQSL